MRFLFVMLSLQASAGHSNILTRVWDKNNNFLQINISSALTTFGVNWQKSVFLNSDDLATQCCDCFFKENWTGDWEIGIILILWGGCSSEKWSKNIWQERSSEDVLCWVRINDHIIGCQTSDSGSNSKFHHLALLVALVSHSSNFHHWPLLALLVALVLH